MNDEHVPHYPTMSRSLAPNLLSHLDRLKYFLATAPSRWSALDVPPTSHQHPALNRFLLPSGEYVTCVMWSGLYHITGTDIVRALVFRFEAFGRPVRNMKKFEEGVFSDLRNLKPGHDACLEEPKSPFLDLLFKYQCIRTQKKQKVFYWFSVPHDRLFLDALERDLKREKMGHEPTTAIMGEPAASFSYDPKRSLYEQFAAKPAQVESEDSVARAVCPVQIDPSECTNLSSGSLPDLDYGSVSSSLESTSVFPEPPTPPPPRNPLARTPFFNMFSLFEGSPTYKQRRKKAPKSRRDTQGHFLSGPGQFSVAGAGSTFPSSSAHVARRSLHMQQCHAPEQPAELQGDQERALVYVYDREETDPEMDVDAGGSPGSQYLTEGPVTPQHAYEEEQVYVSGAAWTHAAATAPAESPAYGASGVPLPTNSGYDTHGYPYGSPTESQSSTDVVARGAATSSHSPPTISVSTSHSYYDGQHQHPLSAPSHRMTFDINPPLPDGTARRPRSVTPSLPARPPHVRRPSTANDTCDVAPSWRAQPPRGYHPYAQQQQRPASTYSSSGSSATSSMLAVQQEYEYDANPFAYMVHGNAAADVYTAPGPAAEQQQQSYDGAAVYGASELEPESPVGYEYAAYAERPEDGGAMYPMVSQAQY